MINSMEIKINNVQFVTTEGEQKVNINFRGSDPENQLHIHGHVPVSVEEYEADATVEGLSKLVKEKVSERLR